MLGPGVEVVVRRGHLTIRGQIPVPAVRRGLRLHPDGDDPYAFRIDLPGVRVGHLPVVFSRAPGGEVTALHLGVLPMSFHKRPGVRNPRPWAAGALAAGATALAVGHWRRAQRARWRPHQAGHCGWALAMPKRSAGPNTPTWSCVRRTGEAGLRRSGFVGLGFDFRGVGGVGVGFCESGVRVTGRSKGWKGGGVGWVGLGTMGMAAAERA